MARFGKVAPAFLWRAFFIYAVAATALWGANAGSAGRLDAAGASQVLEQVRTSDIQGDYYWEFQLHALPRRGEEKIYQGRGWGGRNAQGPIKRIELTDDKGQKVRLLLQNGPRSAVWRWAEGRVSTLTDADLFTPLLPGVELTAFDLQMPFLYWANATLETIQPIRGRTAHVFVLRSPSGFSAQDSQVAAAKVYVDQQLNALMQVELLDTNNRVLKRFSPLSLKTIDKQPLPKTVDFRNEATGNKARLDMTAVALNLKHPESLFQPAALAEDVAPPVGKTIRID